MGRPLRKPSLLYHIKPKTFNIEIQVLHFFKRSILSFISLSLS